MPGTLTVEQIVSADGFAASPDGGIEFFSAAEGGGGDADRDQLTFLADVDAILLGATTYRMFAGYWPGADPAVEPVAEVIAARPKVVFSNTLAHAPWGDGEVEVVGGDAASAVRALKDRFSHVVVWGSLQLSSALFEAGLVDRLRLRVVPVLLGRGRGYLPPGLATTPLDLVGSVAHPQGQVTLDYRVRA